MKKNISLILFSFIFTLFLLEVILSLSGKYKNLTDIKLTPSDAIYERPHSSLQKHKHPDLDYILTNYFDEDGVKNYEEIPTSKKKNIIAIFGDSFTENIAIEKNFEYTHVINNYINDYKVVNYGVGGYSADQVFLRYLKYKNHDIKHVFYLFMPGDIGFSTDIKFFDDEKYVLNKKKINSFYQLIGKFNLTYFAIDSFYIIRSILKKNHTTVDTENYNLILANKIYAKFYTKNLKKCINDKENCNKNFINLLKTFKKEVEKNNSKFHLLIYPNKQHISEFKNILKATDTKFNYYILNQNLEYNYSDRDHKYQFKNDGHWNEYGNVLFAENLLNIFDDIGIKSETIDYDIINKDIDLFYNEYNS